MLTIKSFFCDASSEEEVWSTGRMLRGVMRPLANMASLTSAEAMEELAVRLPEYLKARTYSRES
jgi:formylmethanofuran dehydrogenase subunit B